MDLALLDLSYAEWSEQVLSRIADRAEAEEYLAQVAETDGALTLEEPKAQALAAAFTTYLNTARDTD